MPVDKFGRGEYGESLYFTTRKKYQAEVERLCSDLDRKEPRYKSVTFTLLNLIATIGLGKFFNGYIPEMSIIQHTIVSSNDHADDKTEGIRRSVPYA